MARFCNQCGRPLKEGEVCDCTKNNNTVNNEKSRLSDYERSYDSSDFDSTGGFVKNISDSIGSVLDKIYNAVTPDASDMNKRSSVSIRQLIGFSKEDYIKPLSNVYERGKRLTPDLTQSCNGEILIRQYSVCNVRAVLRGLWQEGRLFITNKRVIFRLSGRSWLGVERTCKEFAIDDIAGIDISHSIKFNLGAFIINTIIAVIPGYLFKYIGTILPMLSSILGILILIFFLFFLRGHNTFKTVVFSISTGLLSGASAEMGQFITFMEAISYAITIICLYFSSLRPTFAFEISTKCASASPISVISASIVMKLLSFYDVLPGKDADIAMYELGAMINDIQKYEDYGVNKWKIID